MREGYRGDTNKSVQVRAGSLWYCRYQTHPVPVQTDFEECNDGKGKLFDFPYKNMVGIVFKHKCLNCGIVWSVQFGMHMLDKWAYNGWQVRVITLFR